MQKRSTTKPELVAPAGDLEKLKVAFHFGADAVYAGLKDFSLRQKTKNFNSTEIKEAIDYTHSIKKKIYITLNIYFTPEEIKYLINYLKLLNKLKPDGIIVADMGALALAKEHAPDIPIHISTQANTTNPYSAKLLQELGAKRIILARELTLKDIAEFNKVTDITLEAFIHGAMCIAYSGRCLLSSYMTHPGLGERKNVSKSEIRSANKGNCSHSCRWEYLLIEKTRQDQEYIVEENEEGTYVFSSKDISMIYNIDDLINAGIKSFKIEGRMKSILYISSIIRAYRQAIDHWADKSISFNKTDIKKELDIVSHREFCTGFFYKSPKKTSNTTKGGLYKREIRLAGLVTQTSGKRASLKLYNTITEKDKFEYIGPKMRTEPVSKIVIFDKDNNMISKANHTDEVQVQLWNKNNQLITPEKLDIIRMEADF